MKFGFLCGWIRLIFFMVFFGVFSLVFEKFCMSFKDEFWFIDVNLRDFENIFIFFDLF